MWPYLTDDEHSVIVLGTMRSPGVVTLSGHDRPKDWDVQKAKGTTGASSNLNGDPIGQFQASFYLADDGADPGQPTDFDLWEDFQRVIESMTNGQTPAALPIYHPDLARNHITEVSNAGIMGMVHDGRGGATVVVKFIEYKPPKPKKSKKASAKPGSKAAQGNNTPFGPPPPDPNAEAKAELASLLAEAKKPPA